MILKCVCVCVFDTLITFVLLRQVCMQSLSQCLLCRIVHDHIHFLGAEGAEVLVDFLSDSTCDAFALLQWLLCSGWNRSLLACLLARHGCEKQRRTQNRTGRNTFIKMLRTHDLPHGNLTSASPANIQTPCRTRNQSCTRNAIQFGICKIHRPDV